jgi:hypothetical protein
MIECDSCDRIPFSALGLGFCVVGRWFCLAAARNFQMSGLFNTFFGKTWDNKIDRFLFETFENSFFMTTIW